MQFGLRHPSQLPGAFVSDLMCVDLAGPSRIVVLVFQLFLQDALLFARLPGIHRCGRRFVAELHAQLLKASLTFSPASFRLDLAWSSLPSFSVLLSPVARPTPSLALPAASSTLLLILSEIPMARVYL